MHEVDFTGWTRTPEELEKLKDNFWYRWSLHWIRFFKATKQKRWAYFNVWNIKGLLFNQKKQF